MTRRAAAAASTLKQKHELFAAIFHHSQARGTELNVLLGIAFHAALDQDGRWTSWPGVRRLARYSNVSERAVQLALRKLVDTQQLTRLINAGGTHDDLRPDQRPNLFVIADPCPADCDCSTSHRPSNKRRPANPPASTERQREHAAAARSALARNRETG